MKRLLSGWKYALLVIGIALLAMLIIDFNSRMVEWRRLSVQRDAVAVQATQISQTQQGYETQIAFATSEAGVMEWAYGEGHMVRPGDELVVPLSQGAESPVATPVPVMQPESINNLQLWLSLFFDERVP